jgi:NAD(P)-dependent dehydrogenase (short-subunit alcohol dehydrogenase family)
LKYKVVLFAGIGRLGIPAVKVLAEAGCKVVISFRKGRSSEETVKVLENDNIKGIAAEISEKQDAVKFVKTAYEEYERIDAIVNIASWYPNEEKDWKRWTKGNGVLNNDWKYYNSNFIPIRNSSLAVLELKDNPAKDVSIINFADARSLLYFDQSYDDPYKQVSGIVNAGIDDIKKIGFEQLKNIKAPNRHINPYTLSKRDIVYLTKKLACDYQGGRVRVNAIAPGPMLPPPDRTIEEVQPIAEQTLLKRWGYEEPITEAIIFLLINKYITGEILKVDGGFYLYHKAKGKFK